MTCSPNLEIIDLTKIVGDLEIPCDFGDDYPHDYPARWVLHSKEHGCGSGGARLTCEECKNIRIASEAGVVCGKCDEFTAPARLAYSSVEPLDRRPS